MMVEGRTKDELVSVTNYEYGLNNWLEKEIKKQGKTTETYRYRFDDNGNETFRIWEKTSPTPDYPGTVKLSGHYQRETPTVYEWRHYDGFNQLSRINQDDKEITYQYRGDGLRHSTQVRKLTESQGKTNLYCWDGNDIVAEQTDGQQIKTYIRGINLIAGEFDRVVYCYILNEHGDVTQLWSQSGACKASHEYDAFGVERNSDKEDENPFRYCGEYFDLSSSTYYPRARDYRPITGRFTREDTLHCAKNQLPNGQEVPDPLSLNLYTYGYNNPLSYQDPSGHFVISTTALVVMGLAAVGAVIGGFVGNHIANNVNVASQDRWKYIAGGAVGGAVLGAAAGYVAGPSIATATGIGGMSVTGAGISTVTSGTVGATGFFLTT